MLCTLLSQMLEKLWLAGGRFGGLIFHLPSQDANMHSIFTKPCRYPINPYSQVKSLFNIAELMSRMTISGRGELRGGGAASGDNKGEGRKGLWWSPKELSLTDITRAVMDDVKRRPTPKMTRATTDSRQDTFKQLTRRVLHKKPSSGKISTQLFGEDVNLGKCVGREILK